MSAKKVHAYLKEKNILLVENRAANKASLKQVLGSLGADKEKIEVAESIESAVKMNDNRPFDIILTVAKLGDQDFREISRSHTLNCPNRRESSLIVIANDPELAKSTLALDSELDLFLCEPVTVDVLNKSLLKLFLTKLQNNPYRNSLYKIKESFFKGEYEESLTIFQQLEEDEEALSQGPLHELYFYKGLLLEKLNKTSEAKQAFLKSHKVKREYYRSLNRLLNLEFKEGNFKEAYSYQKIIVKDYMVEPMILPLMIKLSLANEELGDIKYFAELFPDLNDYEPEIKASLAAALVICGKRYFERGKRKEGIENLKSASKICGDRFNIIEGIISTYIRFDELDAAGALLLKYATKFGEMAEFQALEARVAFLKGDTSGCLKLGIPLVEKKIKNDDVFEIVIKSSIAINRRPELIEKLKEDAAALFPKKANFFLNLRS